DFAARHAIDFRSYFADALHALQAFEADGLVQWQGAHLRITARGRLLTRQVAMLFDAYLDAARSTRYSRAI
ncbi:MAG: oxygen-independent coproporphyrinogen III oxidase, partial [Metallibacterium sp.]